MNYISFDVFGIQNSSKSTEWRQERWKDGRLLSIFSNIPILLDTTSDTWLVDTEGRYRSSKWRPRSVWAHRQRLAPSFNAVTTRRGTQEVRLPDRVANYGERGRVQLRLDEINGEFSSIPWEISMPETGLGRNRNVLRLIRRELGPIFLSLEILDERIKLWQMSRYTRERKRKGDKS